MDRNISVKVSGIHNLTSARYFAARNADYLGFRVDADHRAYCPTEKIAEIISWVEGPAYILETNHLTTEISTISAATQIQNIHVGNPSYVTKADHWQKIFVDVPLDKLLTLTLPENYIPVIQYPGAPAELPEHTTDTLIKWCQNRSCFLDFSWARPKDTVEFLCKSGSAGVIVHGSDDIQTGFQDFDWMDEFFDLLEQ